MASSTLLPLPRHFHSDETYRGRGSAIFLELGARTQRMRLDGSPGEPEGELGVMIHCSWRIVGRNSIICGSWSDYALWEPALLRLQGSTVENVDVFGKLPELSVALSNGHSVLSFMTSEGDPQWTLFDRRSPTRRWLCVRDG
jgi:hypothetical protein